MLRPEAVRLATPSTSTSGHDVQRLAGQVREVSYLGAYSEYLVEAGGATVRVHSGDDRCARHRCRVDLRDRRRARPRRQLS